MHALRWFVASRVPAGGLENALPPSGWLSSDEAILPVPVLWRGSKQERHPRIRSARRGVPLLIEEDFVFIIGIDPHKGSHTAAVIDGDEHLVGELSVRADRRQRERLLRLGGAVRTASVGGRRRDRHRRVVGAAARRGRVRRCWMCRPRCRRGRGCWTRAARTRPTRTTPARPRSSRCGTGTCGSVVARGSSADLAACWRVVTIS